MEVRRFMARSQLPRTACVSLFFSAMALIGVLVRVPLGHAASADGLIALGKEKRWPPSTASVASKTTGCVQCHESASDPHGTAAFRLECVGCHGGNATARVKELAHVQPRFPEAWATSGNPVRSYTLLNHEAPEFIRFVNPGDVRVAHLSCGTAGCHPKEVLQVRKSMMTHGAMLWGAALYNNGAFPLKWAHVGESYSTNGVPQRLQTVTNPPLTEDEMRKKGIVPYLDPLPRFEMTQPGNILRIFERGGRFRPEVGIPERLDEPGRPRTRLSNRGLGTENRTDPVWIGLGKTRLLDPTLNFLGTNDHPGDYRSSGCTACHMIYANDRSAVHSGPYAKYGNRGRAADETDEFVRSVDPTIPKNEPGHPIAHRFTVAIPTSQCIVCHMHPGTNVLNSYLGFMWWDNETDGELMYPKQQKYPSAEEVVQAQMSNPEESAARGNWSDPRFLERVWELNSRARHSQFADFHGHGWVFRAVFKRDRKGKLLDKDGNQITDVKTEKLQAAMRPPTFEEKLHGKQYEPGVPVHLMDIHLERGMHCIDCHFNQDSHGNSLLYGEVRAAIEIQCIDCHGTVTARANLRTSGPAAPDLGRDGKNGFPLAVLRTPYNERRFEWRGNSLIQHSMVEKGLWWDVPQVRDVIDPQHPRYNQKAELAKTVRKEIEFNERDEARFTYGKLGEDGDRRCAHRNDNMSCIACHSSWNPSCFGCHLPQKANKKWPAPHFEGDVSRNLVSYNFQTLRDDVYMLARDGDVTGNRIGPVRSACAIHVGSYNQNRESIYVQQQTISAEGMSGIAFSTNVPHTVRGSGETKQCTDCHVSTKNDNNAIMAQLLMHGTNYTNFIGRYCWIANGEHGLHAVVVTERDEPQAVIGSSLHRLAFPDYFRRHVERGRILEHAHEHAGKDISSNVLHPLRKAEVLGLQARGEYLYAACGEGGLRVFDIAFIDDKGFSERITTAPVSPLGQRFYVPTKYATAVAAPTTIAPDPTRTHRPENREQPVHLMYAFIYVADKYEGLILVGAGTLLDGNPTNNFLKRELTFNPDGILTGARNVTIVGTYAYICCDAGLVVVSLNDPKHPEVKAVLGQPFLKNPKAVQVQFRYAFVCDDEGVKVLNVTELDSPVPSAQLPLPEAHNIYLARTYAYVAGGKQGLVILDIENPEQPRIDQTFNAIGCINDVRDVKLGITYVSEFAYLADGRNGLRVVQLTSPETPGNYGFSPRPTPELVATYPMNGHALVISEGVDRDRAVDESGNQIAVFGRVGARPLALSEQRNLYLPQEKAWGHLWRMSLKRWTS
ncbi:MAG: hypothetical protein HY000_00240 [Planctomycetes bacterium]|nr:hypothetical protein [Planctomycetota bacterium]